MKRLAIIAALFAASPAFAECYPRAELVEALENNNLQAIFAGLGNDGLVTEIWVASDGRWIEVITASGGQSCIFDAGLASAMFQIGDPA